MFSSNYSLTCVSQDRLQSQLQNTSRKKRGIRVTTTMCLILVTCSYQSATIKYKRNLLHQNCTLSLPMTNYVLTLDIPCKMNKQVCQNKVSEIY
jgi:hypothetical protein